MNFTRSDYTAQVTYEADSPKLVSCIKVMTEICIMQDRKLQLERICFSRPLKPLIGAADAGPSALS
jgi:hypothetical protein